MILINAEKMFGSPIAERERWAARRTAAFEAGVSALPPDATELILAGKTDYEFGQPIWELALLKLREPRNVTTIAQRFGGSMDVIAKRSAARLPGDHYVVQITDRLLGSHTPANRQDVRHWLTSTDVSDLQQLSPYLEQAFQYASKVGTPIVMAMDISDAVSEAEIKRKLTTFDAVKASPIKLDSLARLLAGIQGITLGLTVKDRVAGAIRVDFSESPQQITEIGKPLLIEILQRQGAMINDFIDWKPSIRDNTFLLRGTLSRSGTRRVLSVLELPHSLAIAMEKQNTSSSRTTDSAEKLASQQYYKSITTLLDDLRAKPKRSNVKTFGQAAMWYDRYSRKIDRLPILNVDDALISYGTQTTHLLRDAETAMKSVGMRRSLRTVANNPQSSGQYSHFGGYRAGRGFHGNLYVTGDYSIGVDAAQATQREKGRTNSAIRTQERIRGAASVENIWRQIDDASAEIRRAMTRKYNTEF